MCYVIGSFRIDPALRELHDGGREVAVEPKVFDLLLYLVENRARVVGKEELVAQIWQGRIVSEAALSSCVKAARRALGDDGQRQGLIRTIHRRGFRFVGPVGEGSRPLMSGLPAGAAPAPEAAADAGEGGTFDIDLTPPEGPSIAVLPIRAIGGGELTPVLAEGLSHDITVRLARTRWLFVTARASALQFRATEPDLVEIGRRLGVRYLLRGHLAVAGGRLRLTAILTDAVRGGEIWAERFDRPLADIFAVQDELGDLITAAVEAEIEQKERRRALLQPFASLDAWSAYQRACIHLFRFTPEEEARAEVYLRRAAELDPAAARVFAALSFIHWQRAFRELVPDRQGELDRAHDLAQQSLVLDPRAPDGHWALGRALLLRGEFETAVEELRASVALNPNFAKGQYSLSFSVMFTGDTEEGFDRVARARRLSPYDPMTFAFMASRAVLHGFIGEIEAAADWSARAVRQPNAHYHVLAIAAWCHQMAGRGDAAQDFLAELHRVRPGYSRDEYFRAFPFRPPQRAMIEAPLRQLGL
ncbi:MAG: winged helix-turn-helix domain-containing protein [Sneathiellaceae bacterium]